MPQQVGNQEAKSSALFQSERQRKILDLVEVHDAIEVNDLADHFHVTTETIRRDLTNLEDKSLLKRVHGGAVSCKAFEPLVAKRTVENDKEKRRIAARAVQELPQKGSILIDAGSTLARFAEAITPGRSLHVVTNSLPAAHAVATSKVATVTLLGGELRHDTLSIVDSNAVQEVEKLHVDILFISTDGASERGLSTPYTFEATLKQTMIRSASHVVALIDPSKFGQDHLVCFSNWSEIGTLITGVQADPTMLTHIRNQGVEVITV